MLKLYVLIRDDMTDGQQAVQAGHAVAQFSRQHYFEFKQWQENSNVLIYLSVSNIEWWKQVLTDGNFKHAVFHEPELRLAGRTHWDGSPVVIEADTAIAVAPNWTCQYILFKDLPLALQPKPSRPHGPREPEKKRRWWQW